MLIVTYNEILVYSITSVYLVLGIYLTFKTKIEYNSYQKRSLCSSVLCFIYHESYAGFACYTAWCNIWPFFNLNDFLIFHYTLGFIGFFPAISGVIIYFLYLKSIKSVPKAIGLDNNDLITNGMFKISRNPNSLGRIIGLIGITLMGRSYYTLLVAILWISLNHFNILIEERHLENKFGNSYLNYCLLTPRYCKINGNHNNKK